MAVNDDFRTAFYDRTDGWQYVSEQQASTLADLALAQACHESADFSSSLFQTCENAIGYQYVAGARWQAGQGIAKPGGGYYAKYNSVEDCACELADWVHRRAGDFEAVETVEDYAAALQKNGYFEDALQNYVNGMETYYQVTPDGDLSADVPALSAKPTLVDTAAGFTFSSRLGLLLVFLLFFWWLWNDGPSEGRR